MWRSVPVLILVLAASAEASPPPYRWSIVGIKSTGTGDLPVHTAMRFGETVYEFVTPDGEVDRRHVAWNQTGERSWTGQTAEGAMTLTEDGKTGELRLLANAGRVDLRLKPADAERGTTLDQLMLGQPSIEAACEAARVCCETVFKTAAGECDLETELRGMHSLRTCQNFINVVNDMENIPRKCEATRVVKPAAPARPARQRSFKQEQQETRARLKTLFATCRKKNHREAASFIVYRGDDEKRKWKDALRPAIADELKNAEQLCEEVRGYHALGAPRFDKYEEQLESEGRWQIWHVQFGEKKTGFAFLRVGAVLLLGDVD